MDKSLISLLSLVALPPQIGADFLTKEVMVDDRLVTMQVRARHWRAYR